MDIEKWIESKRFLSEDRDKYGDLWGRQWAVSVEDLRELFAGKVLCDAGPVKHALCAVESALERAYNNANPVCCGRSRNGECCGSPEPEWDTADMEIMDALGPMQKVLTDLCRKLYTASEEPKV